MKNASTTILVIALAGFLQSASAADARHVVMNGSNLTPEQITWFDRAQCAFIPDGSYWWNPQGGDWGYAGNPRIQGYVGELCQRPAPRADHDKARLGKNS